MDANRQANSRIPPGAVWNADQHVWELCERNPAGQRQGECRALRADGTLLEVGHYDADVRNGSFVVFHPNGQIARRGLFSAGLLHGQVLAYASDAPTAEVLRACCVPSTAWEMRALYARGEIVREVFRDREGRPLLSDGTFCPDPPPGVSADAEFDEPGQCWVSGTSDAHGNRTGTFRLWSLDGHLTQESEYVDGRVIATRLYAETGEGDGDDGSDARIVEECAFIDEGQRHGAYRRRFPAEESPYANPRIREERGAFDRGRRFGIWTFSDNTGATIGTVDLGLPLDEDRVEESPAFARDSVDFRSGDTAWVLAARLLVEGRVREALCAAARGAARQGDTSALADFVSRNTLALATDVRQLRGDELSASAGETLTSALEALATGVDAAAVFRTLASVLDSAHPAALDFVNASLLLAPERRLTHLTRALIRIEQGDDLGALADATAIADQAPDATRSLREHVRLAFPDFSGATSFWPTREPLYDDPTCKTSPQVPAQSLDAVRHMIQVYATRLQKLRAVIRARVPSRAPDPDPSWLPPDTSALLPDGPVELRHLAIPAPVDFDAGAHADTSMDPDGLDGDHHALDHDLDQGDAVDVQVDERSPADVVERHSIIDLLTIARADWSALVWLCWACGLDRVALPEHLTPPSPENLGAAIALSVARCFRVHDRMITGGVRALAQGLPGFAWQGVDVDQLPNHFARIAAAEYLEIRSMFLWLILPDAVSPFQSDLHEA